MTYPSPPPYGQPAAPPADNSRKFLNLSGGALLVTIAGVLLVCCIGPVALCLATPILGAFLPDVTKDPTTTITRCQIGADSTANVAFTIKNNSSIEESFTVRVEVRDSSGARVGSGYDYVTSVAAGSSANGVADVVLDSPGGATCHIVGTS